MANQYANKIIFGGKVLIDLTADDIQPQDLLRGKKAHDKSGAPIVGSCDYDVDSSGTTATAAEILDGKTAAIKGGIVEGTMPNNGAVHGFIKSIHKPYGVNRGFHDGSGDVSIDEAEAIKIIPENIREGISILGVDGSMSGTEGAKPQAKKVVPTVNGFVVAPDPGFNYLSQVTVSAIPYSEIDNPAGGKTITIATA